MGGESRCVGRVYGADVAARQHPHRTHPPERGPVPTLWDAGWAHGPAWTDVKKVKFFLPTGARTPNRLACSEALYRLPLPGLFLK